MRPIHREGWDPQSKLDIETFSRNKLGKNGEGVLTGFTLAWSSFPSHSGTDADENRAKTKLRNKTLQGLEKRVWWQWFSQGTDGKGGRCLHIFLISESLPQHPQHVMISLKMYFLLLLGGSFTEL